MAILTFSLNPESLNKFYDVLVCLGKFSDYVSVEASQHKLVLTTLNSTKSAYASFSLSATKFFSKYNYKYIRPGRQIKEKFAFKIYNRALISVFKGRAVDPNREKETAVEKCEARVEDEEETLKSRFVIKMICRHGVRKIYRLVFEPLPPLHAIFDKESAHNYWSISSKVLREFTDHFGPGTEQLDIYSEAGRVNFTSFTEKIILGNEILKKPLHTNIAVDTLEFSGFSVEELLHIVISVKEFKAIVAHCAIHNVMVNAFYSHPSNPMQITYDFDGIISEFILMTVGGSFATPANSENQKRAKRPASRQLTGAESSSRKQLNQESFPSNQITRGPSQSKSIRPSPPPLQPSQQSESLFIQQADHDRKWEPLNFDDEDGEMLLWDVTEKDHAGLDFRKPLSNSARDYQPSKIDEYISDPNVIEGIPPTQNLSQVWNLGLFD
ncbi:DNA repair protein rad9 [Golovinomyces cichoracearum]|uniref:DNA repair protein rad9 n=1 Tax=Golovinomyces cichoracearum TaxID=62708 RepID=A0A420IWU5_9PEZI|nr:DNA repair protein rad9 [Golovinomyces cichoracearum]